MDSESELELELITLITQLLSDPVWDPFSNSDSKLIPLIVQIISLLKSIDLDSQPKPESKLMLLVTQAISHFNSMDLDSQPKPFSALISDITQLVNSSGSVSVSSSEFKLFHFANLSLEPEPEVLSLIHQIFSLVVSMSSKWSKLISLYPQGKVTFKKGKFLVDEEGPEESLDNKWECLPFGWKTIGLKGEDATHFLCKSCNGKNHGEYKQALGEIIHPLHPKHSLRLVLCDYVRSRECYCCEKDLIETFYYCSACDFAMNIVCVEKPPILVIDHRKRHEHTLTLFPRLVSITCNVCALDDTSSAVYMCPPCDFFVHRRCLDLPRVIKISRHHHRLCFTPSFRQRELSCHVCRTKIDQDYGGYSCNGCCSYAAHSRCATQGNVWDGKELEGESEEDKGLDSLEPFIRISDGIIQHFGHQQHHLRLDENMNRDYDESKQCQACISPIYFGNLYSCMQCDYILHEECANLSREIHHPIHPHKLTLLVQYSSFKLDGFCSACHLVCTSGFYYECRECRHFKLHVQCATISEPLLHESHHIHLLFLTSKPRETRICSICKREFMETFNCIECDDDDFALCFRCATIPQKVRYKHDKHMLTLSYGKETTMASWCEVCERRINPKKRFYTCDEYCCVTLHMKCMLGTELYMKAGSSWYCLNRKVSVMSNINHHMCRPICSNCEKRCSQKIVFQYSTFIFCSKSCCWLSLMRFLANAIA